MLGHVKWFGGEGPKRGYGFITGDDKLSYFVHYTAIVGDGYRTLTAGQRVQFEPATGPKGTLATNVRVVDESPRDEPEGVVDPLADKYWAGR